MMKFDKLGWLVAAMLAGGMIGMGFQTAAPKFASVDMAKVFDSSDATKQNDRELHAAQQTRLNVLQFIGTNRAMLPADAVKYAALAVKSPIGASDKSQLDQITADAEQATSQQRQLATLQKYTDAQQKQMQDLSDRGVQNAQFIQQLQSQYTTELQELQSSLRDKSLAKVRDVVVGIARRQGYTVVFSQDTAPYAANDITAQALKAVGTQ